MLELDAVAEPQPGESFRARFDATWPAYRAWYLRDGDAARPAIRACRHALELHMPELVPTWERLVELAGGDELAARMLSLYDAPALVTGASHAAVRTHPEPLLVRNYDFDPVLLEGVIALTAYTGRRVLGTSDCLWGLLDGINDAGLAMSLAFGGERATAPGFAMPLIVRYVLELCATTQHAVAVLARLPVQASYNLTIVDREGDAVTAQVAPDKAAQIGRPLDPVDADLDEDELVAAFLEPPLHKRGYDDGFGTLYTAVYRPTEGAVDYQWPDMTWRQSIDAFEEGTRAIRLTRSHSSRA